MSIQDKYKRESEQLQMFLSEVGEMLGQQTGFVQRESPFGGNEMVQMMTLGCLENGQASLNDLCRVAQDLGVRISGAGLHQRISMESVELLSQVFQLWIDQQQSPTCQQILCHFAAVHIVDSSRIKLSNHLAEAFPGGRNGATMKIQLGYEYRRGQIEALWIEDGRTPDQSCNLPDQLSQAGDLVLFDLGYTNQHLFETLSDRGVYFLTRLQGQIGLYADVDDSDTFDLLAYVNQLPPTIQMGERQLYIGQKVKVAVRLVYYRVPPAIAEERRRKAKKATKARGKVGSQQTLDRLDWAFFITNVPESWLPTEYIHIIYRVRWQIEILFKVWKQEMDWAVMGQWRVARILTQFYGRCLAIMVCHSLLQKYLDPSYREISWQKAYRHIKRRSAQLITLVRRSFRGIGTFLIQLDRHLQRFACKDKRRKSLSTHDLLELIHA